MAQAACKLQDEGGSEFGRCRHAHPTCAACLACIEAWRSIHGLQRLLEEHGERIEREALCQDEEDSWAFVMDMESDMAAAARWQQDLKEAEAKNASGNYVGDEDEGGWEDEGGDPRACRHAKPTCAACLAAIAAWVRSPGQPGESWSMLTTELHHIRMGWVSGERYGINMRMLCAHKRMQGEECEEYAGPEKYEFPLEDEDEGEGYECPLLMTDAAGCHGPEVEAQVCSKLEEFEACAPEPIAEMTEESCEPNLLMEQLTELTERLTEQLRPERIDAKNGFEDYDKNTWGNYVGDEEYEFPPEDDEEGDEEKAANLAEWVDRQRGERIEWGNYVGDEEYEFPPEDEEEDEEDVYSLDAACEEEDESYEAGTEAGNIGLDCGSEIVRRVAATELRCAAQFCDCGCDCTAGVSEVVSSEADTKSDINDVTARLETAFQLDELDRPPLGLRDLEVPRAPRSPRPPSSPSPTIDDAAGDEPPPACNRLTPSPSPSTSACIVGGERGGGDGGTPDPAAEQQAATAEPTSSGEFLGFWEGMSGGRGGTPLHADPVAGQQAASAEPTSFGELLGFWEGMSGGRGGNPPHADPAAQQHEGGGTTPRVDSTSTTIATTATTTTTTTAATLGQT